eukprot:jgi/Mesen1/6539/ME000334S05877
MAATVLEQTRAAHEDNERLERLIVKDLQQDVKGHKERLHQNHRVASFVDQIVTNSARLVEVYEDKDGARKDEIAAIGGQNSSNNNVFSAFYDRLKEIREYHRRHPGARVMEQGEDEAEQIKEEPFVEFSGEEAFGRYLDMHELYRTFTNSKFGEPLEYSAYLAQVADMQKVARRYKSTKAYKDYIAALGAYLSSFFERTQPLQDLKKIFAKEETVVEEDSDDEDGQIYNPLKLPMGWDGKPIPYWLYKLHGLGQATQKAKRRICGGRGFRSGVQGSGVGFKLLLPGPKSPFRILCDTTRALGGLRSSPEFKCEICGNTSYWGRRAFERHFKEWRHQHGMRCLGIPNIKAFNEITVIKDATDLWERIKEKQGLNKWRPEVEEEYEDTQGNVYSKQDYTILQRQGLI